jgi:hypothetical protein
MNGVLRRASRKERALDVAFIMAFILDRENSKSGALNGDEVAEV